ncbi:hypothetical protein [Halocatena halophila]|uniref:hypothetical protein n=1 Tax=Halocatena halophila TaxID=2814576 RepID=UPI002ED2A969
MVRLVKALNGADDVQFANNNKRMYVRHGKTVVLFRVSDWEIMDVVATATLDVDKLATQ